MSSKSELIKDRFGSVKEGDLNYLIDIERIQDKLPGRVQCSLTFKNNLESVDGKKYSIKYLKLGHVLEGQEAFVYERMNIKNRTSVLFEKYFIGTNLKTKFTDHVPEDKVVKDNKNKRDGNNIYDKLYVQFVIEVESNGVKREIVYNQSYEQFLKEELLDLFSIDGFNPNNESAVEYFKHMNINLYFHPRYNSIVKGDGSDDLRLTLGVSMPTKRLIETTATVL